MGYIKGIFSAEKHLTQGTLSHKITPLLMGNCQLVRSIHFTISSIVSCLIVCFQSCLFSFLTFFVFLLCAWFISFWLLKLIGLVSFSPVSSAARLPCFGLDIGGTLVKLVYFEPHDFLRAKCGPEKLGLNALQEFITSNLQYGETGARDEPLAMNNVLIGGRCGNLHFIRFPTCQMDAFLELARELNASALDSKVCATGGGAFKFEGDFRKVG